MGARSKRPLGFLLRTVVSAIVRLAEECSNILKPLLPPLPPSFDFFFVAALFFLGKGVLANVDALFLDAGVANLTRERPFEEEVGSNAAIVAIVPRRFQ